MGIGGFGGRSDCQIHEWMAYMKINQLHSSHARWAMRILGNIDDAISFIAL